MLDRFVAAAEDESPFGGTRDLFQSQRRLVGERHTVDPDALTDADELVDAVRIEFAEIAKLAAELSV